ncbi:MAG: DNA replication/repair protein RecF [Paracoccus sp. (in: a-proteobacteria)]|nr:DNA replication/repair protein RecF [Paracoccus sp. (in: a-proteobacteria)]
MILTRVSLAQFRSWRRLDLALDGRPVALFGPNGSGKTNVLEALSMLAPGRGLRGAPPAEQGRLAVGAGWRVRASLGEHEIQTGAAPGTSREVLIDDKPAPQAALGRLMRVIWLVPAMDRLWSDAPETRRRFLDRLTLSFQPDHAETALAYDKAMRERNRLLRDQIADAHWYAALEAQMGEAGARLTANRQAAIAGLAAQTRDEGGFPVAHLALLPGEGFADETEAATITARLAEGRRRDMAAGRSLTGPHRADLGAHWGPDATPAALSSTGEQKALLISLILANARALEADHPLLLLDEIAAHLDANRRAALYAQLASLQAQVVMTGTGPELFEALDGRLLGVAREDGESRLI